jgi:hypothetical protein
MTFAEQISQTLVARLAYHQILAKELAKCDEVVAAAALDTFKSLVASGYWLTTVQPVLGSADKTPMELSRMSEGKAAVFLALGCSDHEIFG